MKTKISWPYWFKSTIVVLSIILVAAIGTFATFSYLKVDVDERLTTELYLEYKCPKHRIFVTKQGSRENVHYYRTNVCGVKQRWACTTTNHGMDFIGCEKTDDRKELQQEDTSF
jgi:hypothetical protein